MKVRWAEQGLEKEGASKSWLHNGKKIEIGKSLLTRVSAGWLKLPKVGDSVKMESSFTLNLKEIAKWDLDCKSCP